MTRATQARLWADKDTTHNPTLCCCYLEHFNNLFCINPVIFTSLNSTHFYIVNLVESKNSGCLCCLFFLLPEVLESTQDFLHLENVKALNNIAFVFPREAFELLMESMPLSSGPTYQRNYITYTIIKAHCRNAFNLAIGCPCVSRHV